MIEYLKGDLFKSAADALVNPVNCEGVMGKGLALEFKRRWPEMYKSYQISCTNGELQPGSVILFRGSAPQIILFATKGAWRNPSQYEYIETGLDHLKTYLGIWGLSSIAMPAIGCGLGGLAWPRVKELIEIHLHDVPARIEVYEP